MVNVGDWVPGVVTVQWLREPLWKMGVFMPYGVELADGRKLWSPRDTDKFIKAAS